MKARAMLFLMPLALSGPRAQCAATVAAEPPLTVVNVSSHCDWCWGHTRLWHEGRYAETIRQVLGLMREHPNYIWQLENENEELAPFLRKAAGEWPGLVEEFWGRVREKRIEVIGAVCNPRLTEVYPETLVRNLVLAKEDFARMAPEASLEVYNAIDLMCGPSQMPQVLAGAGYRYFMFSRPVGPQVVFWRKGLDGTRMLSSRCFYGYDKMGKFGEPVKGFLPSPVWRIAIGGDDQLPDPELPRQAAAWDPRKKILGTNARYFQEVEKSGEPLTELEGPLDSLECYVEAGLHGTRSLYMQNNQDEDLLLCLEKAQVMALVAGKPADVATVERLWRDVLSCAGHAIQWAWTVDYEERLAFARHRRRRIEQAIHEVLLGIAEGIKFRADLGAPVVVFNFHGWPVTGPVELTLQDESSPMKLCDGVGAAVPIQEVSQTAGERGLAFIAENVPPCGYATFYLSRGETNAAAPKATPEPGGAGEGDLEMRLLADGSVEITDKGGESMPGDGVRGFGEVVYYDAPRPTSWGMNGPLGARQSWVARDGESRRIQGPVFTSVRSTGVFGQHVATREIRLWHKGRRVDYQVEIEAGEGSGVFSLRFPSGDGDRVRAGIPFGAEARDNFEKEPFRGEFFVAGYPNGYCATRWTDISSPERGLTFICPPGAHTGYAFDREAKALDFILLRVRPLTAAKWGQMHPSITGKGRHVLHCAALPHPGLGNDAERGRQALEFHAPLLAFTPDLGIRRARVIKVPINKAATLEDRMSFAEVGAANIILSTLRVVGGGSVEARFYEASGKASEAQFRLRRHAKSVEQTDFLGKSAAGAEKIEMADGMMRLKVGPWKIVTLRIELE